MIFTPIENFRVAIYIKEAQNGFLKNVSLTKTHVSDSGPYSPSVFMCIHFFMFVWTNF